MCSRGRYIFLIVFAAALTAAGELFAQAHPERKHIRSGNKTYETLDYTGAEEKYRDAMMKSVGGSYEAAFNLGDALYKQERFEEAESAFKQLSEAGGLTQEQLAKTYYNLGNSQFQQQKLKEAQESYQNSLINNPADLQAKHNLAYVQKLLEEQENDGGGGGNDNNQQDQQDQNQDQNQDQEQNNDSENQSDPEQNDQNQDNPDQGGEQDQPDKPEPQQQPEPNISKEDAEQMLEAIQRQEDKTREKMDEKKKALGAPSGKNW